MSGRHLAPLAAILGLLILVNTGHAQRRGGYYQGYAPPGFGYPSYLATPYSTWYGYFPDPYRYPEYGMFAPARMYADPYVSPYGPRFPGRYGGNALIVETAPVPSVTNAALIEVSVPADAQILFDGTKTSQTGPNRVFETPALTPGKDFEYEVTARWQQDGKEVEQKKSVTVRAGERARLEFTGK